MRLNTPGILSIQVNVWLAVSLVVLQTCIACYLLRERNSEIRQLTAELVRMNQMQK